MPSMPYPEFFVAPMHQLLLLNGNYLLVVYCLLPEPRAEWLLMGMQEEIILVLLANLALE